MIIIDSSHHYAHTLRELVLWFRDLAQGGLMVLHDCAPVAAKFDITGQGGVDRALREWAAAQEGRISGLTLGHHPEGGDVAEQAYKDPYGIGIVQKY